MSSAYTTALTRRIRSVGAHRRDPDAGLVARRLGLRAGALVALRSPRLHSAMMTRLAGHHRRTVHSRSGWGHSEPCTDASPSPAPNGCRPRAHWFCRVLSRRERSSPCCRRFWWSSAIRRAGRAQRATALSWHSLPTRSVMQIATRFPSRSDLERTSTERTSRSSLGRFDRYLRARGTSVPPAAGSRRPGVGDARRAPGHFSHRALGWRTTTSTSRFRGSRSWSERCSTGSPARSLVRGRIAFAAACLAVLVAMSAKTARDQSRPASAGKRFGPHGAHRRSAARDPAPAEGLDDRGAHERRAPQSSDRHLTGGASIFRVIYDDATSTVTQIRSRSPADGRWSSTVL